MSKYDLRFTIGLEQSSRKEFKQQLDSLTQPRSIPIKLNLKEFNTFKNVLSTGLETTVKFHADVSELQRAVNKFGIHDITKPVTTESFISQQTISNTEKRISDYSKLIDKFVTKEKETRKAFDRLKELTGISGKKYNDEAYTQTLKGYKTQLKEARYSNPNAIQGIQAKIDKLQSARTELWALSEDYNNLANRILSSLNKIENDPYMTKDFTDEITKRRFKSSAAFLKSMQESSAAKFVPQDLANFAPEVGNPKNIDGVKNLTKAMQAARTELRAFIDTNKISVGKNGLIQGISELDGNQLSQVNRIIETAEAIRTKYHEETGRWMNIGTQKNEGVVIQALKTQLVSMTDQMNTIVGTLNYETDKAGTTVTNSAAAKLIEDFSQGLSNIPINSFTISPEAIESVREQIQAQLSNITVGKTVTLTSNADEKAVQEKVTLPDVIIGSLELSTEAIAKLRADTQTALNNVSLEPSADETAFTEAFERVSKTYQSKLNALGRKLTKAIEKPTIEEFDAQPAIDKMKAQINNALKSFKFNIGGTVAGASISSKDAALVTREAISSRVDSLLNQLDKNYAKIQKYKVFPEAMVRSNKDNADIINKLQAFKGELSAVNATTGDFVLPFEKAKEKLAELITEVAKLDRELAQTGQRMPMLKTADDIEKNIIKILGQVRQYEELNSGEKLKEKLSYGDNNLLSRIRDIKIKLPTTDIDEVNNDLLRMLGELKEVEKELSVISTSQKNVSITTRDALNNRVDEVINQLTNSYSTIRKNAENISNPQAYSDMVTSQIEELKNFKKSVSFFDEINEKYSVPLEEARKELNELIIKSEELNNAINKIGERSPLYKIYNEAEKQIENMITKLNKYKQTDNINTLMSQLKGDEENIGLLQNVKEQKQGLVNQNFADANFDATKLLHTMQLINDEFAAATKDAPLTKELEKAEVDAMKVQKSIVNLQERMQKSLVANSKGFSQAQYKQQFDMIYEATKSDALTGDDVSMLTTKFKQLENSMREAGVTGKSFGDVMRGMYAKFGSWTMVTMTIQRVIMTFKRMVAAVQEVDSALTNLRKVTDATEADLGRFMRGVGDNAHKLGATMSDLVNATAEFSRLGYDLNQSQKLGELATMYKSVAEDLDITTASQSIVSTLKAFEKAGISAERIVDVFNYVGNNFAISSAGIGEAMQRSAASLQTANNSLEQSIALITAANTVAQDPIKVGTAMKTLSARIRGSKTELVELGEDIEFLTEGTSKLRNEIKSLSGVDIMIDNNNFKSTYQIIDELSTAYQGMVETSQARLAELLGGKNQANIVSALLENFDVARDVLKDSTEKADGSAEKELETSLDSINGKVNQLHATWQKFATDMLESDGFKLVISGADKLLQILDKLIGGSNTLIKLAPMVLAGFSIVKGKSPFSLLSGAVANIKDLLAPMQALSKEDLAAQFAHFNRGITWGGMTPDTYFETFASRNLGTLRGYIQSVENLETASVDGLVAYQEEAMAETQAKSARFMSSLKNIGANLLLILGTQLAVKLGEYIWEQLPFTEKHKQKIREYAEKATQTLNENINKNISDTSSVEEMTAEFNKLAAGVGSTGENLSLTNSQYDTYKSYVEKLIEINPSLVQGINAQGDAFINNKTAIEETTKALKEQQRAIYSNFFNGVDNANSLENLVNDYEKVEAKINKGSMKEESIDTQMMRNLVRSDLLKLSNKDKRVEKLLGIKPGETTYSIQAGDHTEEFARLVEQNRQKILELAQENGYSPDEITKTLNKNEELLTQVDQQRERLKSIGEDFDDYVEKYAKSRRAYYDLSELQTRMVSDYIESYNFSDKMFKEDAKPDDVEKQMRSDINEYIDFLSQLSDEANRKINEITTLDKSTLSYSNYKAKVDELIKEIVEDPTYNKDLLSESDLRIQLGVNFEINDGEIENEYENMIDNLVNRFVRKSLPTAPSNVVDKFSKDIEEKLRELTPDNLSKLYNAEDLNIFSSWDRAKSYVDVEQVFNLDTYKESIEEITKDLKTLGEAYKKIQEGKLSPEIEGSTEEVMALVLEYEELGEYVDYDAKNFGNLEEGLQKVIQTRPDKLIDSFKQLGNLAAKDKKEVEGVVRALRNLVSDALGQEVSAIIKKGLNESDYLTYVKNDYDKIIKNLEKQKEATEEVNDSLEEQKEKLDEIVDKYETAGNTVIKTIEDKIDDVTKYYDEQIDKLKEENEELEKNIDLQEKRDALANARKTKLHVYSETQGWYYTTDKAAIKKAEDELAKSEREVKIADLEKERDAEIKLWEEYKEAWQDAMDSYTKAHDEAITEGILGVEWREKVIERDEDMLDTYQYNYSNFKNQLDNNIDEQIKKNKEYVDSIDKKIKEYQKDIDEMQDWVDEQNNEKLRYFDLIDDIKVTEQNNQADRLSNFEEFKNNWKRIHDEIMAMNGEAEVPDEPKYKINYNGNINNSEINEQLEKRYSSEDAAMKAREALANKISKIIIEMQKKTIPGALMTQKMKDEIKQKVLDNLSMDIVGSYANGGVISHTGIAQVHGTPTSSEVTLNASQARTVYDFIASGALSKATAAMADAYNMLINALPKPSLNGINLPMSNAIIPNSDKIANAAKSVSNEITISFPNANINAKDYNTFKDYMDRYTNDLMLKMQVGL